VWLYNVGSSPETVDWSDPSNMPFPNPSAFCKDETIPRLTEDSIVECAWSDSGVEISVNGLLLARLEPGSKPGYSRLALRSNAVAKRLQ
jgi:hypothetical protein